MIGSAWQAASMMAFLSTQTEVGLFTVALPCSAWLFRHHPAYVLACANCFGIGSLLEMPDIVLFSGSGMALVPGSPACSRPLRILCTGFCGRHRRKHSQLLIVSVLVGRKRQQVAFAQPV